MVVLTAGASGEADAPLERAHPTQSYTAQRHGTRQRCPRSRTATRLRPSCSWACTHRTELPRSVSRTCAISVQRFLVAAVLPGSRIPFGGKNQPSPFCVVSQSVSHYHTPAGSSWPTRCVFLKTACNREGFPVPRRRVDAPRPLHDYHDLPPR